MQSNSSKKNSKKNYILHLAHRSLQKSIQTSLRSAAISARILLGSHATFNQFIHLEVAVPATTATTSTMCNFTNRLFVFMLLAANNLISHAAPAYLQHDYVQQQQRGRSDLTDLIDLFDQDTDYDLHYDQRQKGDENVRIKLDSFFIGLPPQEQTNLVLVTEDLTDYLAEALLGSGKSQNSPTDNNASAHQATHLNRLHNAEQPHALIVEIPPPKREAEGRQQSEQIVADDSMRSRTKFHMHNLLKLLKSRKD